MCVYTYMLVYPFRITTLLLYRLNWSVEEILLNRKKLYSLHNKI